MNLKLDLHSFGFVIFLTVIGDVFCAMTMKQLLKSMDMMRDTCSPKFSLSPETLAGLRKGVFLEDRELKCYTLCIAQMAGTITRKNEISLEKTIKQLESMLPPDIKQLAIETVTLCKDVQKQYKDPCDKTFYSAKCGYELQPDKFMFP
uniref:Odorant-binding protein 22 n=1 Tax=Bradysia odoriphaga TaxID=1564500 RepID=A0A2S0X9I0_9DIPT|nr:odorant-binding protein 22 [Bradysia odoriphaga]